MKLFVASTHKAMDKRKLHKKKKKSRQQSVLHIPSAFARKCRMYTHTSHTQKTEPIRRNSIFVKWLKSHFPFAISFIRGIILGLKKNINIKEDRENEKNRECIRYLCIRYST